MTIDHRKRREQMTLHAATLDRNDEIAARCGYEAGARGGKTDKGFPQYNPFVHLSHNWHIWNDAFARGARDAGYAVAVKADHDSGTCIVLPQERRS
jgi:hypothetical protein